LAFPPFSTDNNLLKDKSCHIIEPYDDDKLISVFVLKNADGSIIKILDQEGVHLTPDDAGPIGQNLMVAININIHLRVRQSQLFFSIKNEDATLVDVFNGKNFISPGMLQDVYGKRLKIQNTRVIEKYDPDKKYDAIIKPTIVCYSDKHPIYIKG